MTYAEFKQNAPDWMHDEFLEDYHTFRYNTQTVEEYWFYHAEYWTIEYNAWLQENL